MDIEKWMLTLIYACKMFRSFLISQHLVIITCMPFGLTNVVFTFNHLAIHVFQPFLGKFVRVFINDFAIYSKKIDHLEKVRATFKRLN